MLASATRQKLDLISCKLSTYRCHEQRLIRNDLSHINSVDKDTDGDFLISARHVSTIYKIAGLTSPSGLAPGEIIWRLGGKRSSFPIMDSEVAGTPSL